MALTPTDFQFGAGLVKKSPPGFPDGNEVGRKALRTFHRSTKTLRGKRLPTIYRPVSWYGVATLEN
jgi:hypothetical protein